MPPWNSAKAKVQLRLSVQRLRTLQQKKEAQAKSTRRDVALLLERGKIETAKIKVENIINEDIYLELLELLELYCELVIARFSLLDQNQREPDPGISEGVCSIIYAAPRTDLKELHILRDILMHKYGREFSAAVMENRDGCVSDRVARKLAISTPSPELVDSCIAEIAKAYGIDGPFAKQGPVDSGDQPSEDQPGGGIKEKEDGLPPSPGRTSDPFTASDAGKAHKLPDIPPAENEGNRSQQGNAEQNPGSAASEKPPTRSSPPQQYDFDALTKRFEALKKT